MAPWILTILSWRSWKKQQKQKGHSDFPPPFFREIGHKTLRGQVFSLYLEESNSLISEDKGTQRRILTNRACQVSPSWLHCLHIYIYFLGPHLQHLEAPRPGVQWKLQLQAYTTALGNARSSTHWAGPGIKSASSCMLVVFFSPEPQ